MTGQFLNFTLHLSPRARQYFYPDPLHISYTDSPSWEDLTEKVFSWFGIPGDDFALSYEDEDGDEVRISSEEELRIRCALISRACRSSRNEDGKPVDLDFDVLDLRVERERRRAEKKPWVAPLSRLPLRTINNASAIPEAGDHSPSRAPLSRLSIQYKLTVHRQGSRAVSMYSPTPPTIGRPMPYEGSDAIALAQAVARSAPVSQPSFRPDTAVKPMQADDEVLPLRSRNPAPTPYTRGHSRVHSQPLISVRPLAVVTPTTAPPSSIRFSASIHTEPTSPPGALKRRSAIRLKGQRRISVRKGDEGLPSEAIELLRSIDELTTPGAAEGVRGFHADRRLVTA